MAYHILEAGLTLMALFYTENTAHTRDQMKRQTVKTASFRDQMKIHSVNTALIRDQMKILHTLGTR